MDDLLSVDDIRRWIAGQRRPDGKAKFWEDRGDWSYVGFCRAVGVDVADMSLMADGRLKFPLRVQKRVSRFIRDWENGLLSFARVKTRAKGSGKQPMSLIHLQTPKPRAIKMAVSWTRGAKLTITPRPAPNPRIPHFRDLFAVFKEKR